MRAKVLSAGSVEQAVVVAVTNRRSGPSFTVSVLLIAVATAMVLSFQNCSVDLSTSTPGASTSGACTSPSAAALSGMQPVFDNFIKTSCASCHGTTTGSVRSGFYTPDSTASGADAAVQSYAYTQLCLRGGNNVALKIDGTNTHSGGTFPRSSGASVLYTYLTTYLGAQ